MEGIIDLKERSHGPQGKVSWTPRKGLLDPKEGSPRPQGKVSWTPRKGLMDPKEGSHGPQGRVSWTSRKGLSPRPQGKVSWKGLMDPKEEGHRSEYKRCDLPCVVTELLPVGSRSASHADNRLVYFFGCKGLPPYRPLPVNPPCRHASYNTKATALDRLRLRLSATIGT